MKIDKIAF